MATAAALALAAMAGPAQAIGLDLGNSDVEARWDNSIRYNAGWRAEKVNPAFNNRTATDETEGGFKRGDMVTNRVDLLSELDVVYKQRHGFRISAAAWDEGAYGNTTTRNPSLSSLAAGAYQNNRYNGYADRFIRGPSGEILDAFAFTSFDLGSSSVTVRAGRHNVYWGESTFAAANSIAYSQGAIDTLKAATSPGVEAKETYLPRNQISAQANITEDLSVAALYAFQWQPYRLVPGGTFFATADATRSDYAAGTAANPIVNGADLRPSNSGDMGVNMRWSPQWLDGTAGIYFRKFDEKLPWAFSQITGAAIQSRFNFARDTKLLGLSYNTNLSSVAVGSELSYRHNTALNSTGISAVVAPGVDPSYAQVEGARGNTLHGLINGTWLMPKTTFWEGGTLVGELNFSHLASVTENANRFLGVGYACPAGQGKNDGCSTRNAVGVNALFTPQWTQVFAGIDLSMPVSLAYQIYGNGAALGGGNEGGLVWSVGLTGTLRSKYDFSLRYADAHYRYKTVAGIASTTNGGAVQNNHGWLAFTFKTSF